MDVAVTAAKAGLFSLAKEKLAYIFTRMPLQASVAIAAAAYIYFVHRAQFDVMMYKFALVSVSSIIAFTIDKTYYRKTIKVNGVVEAAPEVIAARFHSRALIYVGTVLGFTLGV